MKIIVEITDEDFKWEYKIGSSEQKGTTCLTEEAFLAFASILQICHKASYSNDKKEWDKLLSEVGVREYIKKHPEEAWKILNNLKEE